MQRVQTLLVWLALLVSFAACSPPLEEGPTMNEIAEQYVKLVLAVGLHDPDYVDAYFGPSAWRQQVETEAPSLESIHDRARTLLEALDDQVPAEESEARRRLNLARTLESLVARVEFLTGTVMPFDEESRALFDAVAPRFPTEHFAEILARLDRRLPGTGSVGERYESFKADFVIPSDRLDAVFRAAIDACREQTQAFLDLPKDESFTVEYVTDKSWSGYNWYKGSYHSLIQVNTDLPIYIDRALDLACHEGYPGHHVYNLLLEKNLLRDRGWIEYSVYPLFSPRSLIAEGTANFGIEVAFPAEQRQRFEEEVLFPLAGLPVDRVAEYYAVLALVRDLSHAGNAVARQYLDGEIDDERAVELLTRYSLMAPDRARQRLRFIEQYRSYVINYNHGQDLVRAYIEAHGGTADNPARRWELFTELLSNPTLPSRIEVDS